MSARTSMLMLALVAACGGQVGDAVGPGGPGPGSSSVTDTALDSATDSATGVAVAPAALAAPVLVDQQAPAAVATALVDLPAIDYRPLFVGDDEPETQSVAAFRLERHAVTNRQFRAFVAANPEWRRGRVPAIFADDSYLRSWIGELAYPAGQDEAPVTGVSWFAARAYARWVGRRLPTVAEWEAVAAASETAIYGREEADFVRRILDWYARPRSRQPAAVGSAFCNVHGVDDMHGLIWEWVEDFNTALVTGESRGDTGLERNLFCGAGSIGSADPADYAAFMRFAFRSSLRADYAVQNLGFRCATEAQKP